MKLNKYSVWILILFFVSCGSKNQEVPQLQKTASNSLKLTDKQLANAELTVAIPSVGKGHAHLSLKGQIETPPENKISLNFPMTGYVKKIRVMSGQSVKKGELIAVIEDMKFLQLQQDYLMGKSRLVQLESELKRQEILSESQASSKKQLEMSRSERDQEFINLKATAERLKLIGINPDKITAENMSTSVDVVSPIQGYITGVHVNNGMYISENQPIVELINPAGQFLRLYVYEKDIDLLEEGQLVKAYKNTQPGHLYFGRVAFKGKKVLSDKSVEVICTFEKTHPDLIPGLFMNADIEVRSASASSVPKTAVINESGKNYVFAAKGSNEFSLKPVELLWESDDSLGIANPDGAPINESIVFRNAYTLFMQLRNNAE